MNAADAVRQHAHYHAQLVAGIAELEHVAGELIQQESHIADLEGRIKRGTDRIKPLERKTTTRRLVYEEILHATTRRLTAKLTGRLDKFEAEVNKEERAYHEALQKESEAKEELALLETMVKEGKVVQASLKHKAEIYELTKKDLAELYRRIFDGPTPAYPEDDQLEYQLQLAERRHSDAHAVRGRESQALLSLQSANSALLLCASKMQEAISGSKTKTMKRGMLSAAEGLAMQSATNVQQAILASPHVQPVGDINIAHGSIWSDVVFDNIFSEKAFHDKIKTSVRDVADVQAKLTAELAAAKVRAEAAGADLNAAAEAVTRAQAALEAFRRSVFDSLSNVPAELPPGYDAPVGQPDAPTTVPATAAIASSDTPLGPPPGPPLLSPASHTWGNRNPFAAFLAQVTSENEAGTRASAVEV
ncbi:hypothetical protein FB451DRAFT_1275570 [Mycena latifolia]|nr:hypothetical protein FB451DRAFT_1275570 [Mycena latifolia]